jgi:hypothetical protein
MLLIDGKVIETGSNLLSGSSPLEEELLIEGGKHS